MIQTQGNGEKPHFGPDLDALGPNLLHQFVFFQKSSVTSCYGQQLLAVNYFRKKLHLKCLTGFWVRRCNNKVHGPWNCWSQSSAGKVFFRWNLVWNHFRNENEKSEKFTFFINQLQESLLKKKQDTKVSRGYFKCTSGFET